MCYFCVWDFHTVPYSSNITNVWQEILTPMTLPFSGEVVHEKLWESVNICKSCGKKIWHLFMWTRCIFIHEKLSSVKFVCSSGGQQRCPICFLPREKSPPGGELSLPQWDIGFDESSRSLNALQFSSVYIYMRTLNGNCGMRRRF